MRNRRSLLLSRFFLPALPDLIRTRVAIGCSFFIQGMVFATWCARIPDIRASLGLNEAQLGTLLLAIPVGQLVSMAPNGILVTRFGSRRMLILAGFLYPCILLFLGIAPTVWALAIGLLAAGFAANLSNTAANTQGVELEHYYRRSIIALFHGMWSLAGLVAVGVALLLALADVPTWLHFALVAGGMAVLLSFSGGALLPCDRHPASDPAAELMQLAEPEPLGALDHHDGRIRHIDAHLDHGSGHEDIRPAGSESIHIEPFLLVALFPVDYRDLVVGEREGTGYLVEALFKVPVVQCLAFKDEGIDDEHLAAEGDLVLHEPVQCIALPFRGVHCQDRFPSRRKLVYDRYIQVSVQGHRQGPRYRGGGHHQYVGRYP